MSPDRGIIHELKRRRVIRVTIAYVALGLGIIYAAEAIFENLPVPEWATTLVIVLIGLGLPLAIGLAWAFDVTPRGIERTSDETTDAGGDPHTPASGGVTSSEASTSSGSPSAEAIPEAADAELDVRALAVLPFENLSRTDEAEPVTAGLHDDLITALSKISGLTVISRTSMRGYRDTEKTVPQIARELGVGTLVEGGVQIAGERLRLNVQLIDAGSDVHRWAETYDQELNTRNIFEIQTELTRRIVDSLETTLAVGEPAAAERPATDDLEAYRLYSRGRVWLDRRTEEGLRRAMDHFQSAIDRDAAYAHAWAGLAEAVLLLRWYDHGVPDGATDPATAARRASELGPELGEAHTSLGILLIWEQEGPSALRELERAIELGPGDAEAYIWLSWLNLAMGRVSESLAPAERALELDPLSPAMRVFGAEALLVNGRVDEALGETRRAREMQPDWGLARFMEALTLYHLDRLDEARDALQEVLPLVPASGQPSHQQVWAVLGLVCAAQDDRDGAEEHLARIDAANDGADSFASGLVHAALDDVDEAFAAFDRVERWGPLDTELLRYLFPAELGPLRRDARYERLLASVDRSWGLPPGG